MILPISEHEEEIIQTVLNNKVTIIVGQTGSGKTTMIPQILCNPKFTEEAKKKGLMKKIGVTQPRRVAATSVAYFVAKQLNSECGKEVGYKIRWDDSTSEGTLIKFMTDGILLREMQIDPDLKDYSIIMIDEAHERSLNMDFLIGLIKDLLTRRDDIRIIISSATIEEEKFSAFFNNAPIIRVKGKMFDVETIYDEKAVNLSTENHRLQNLTEKIIGTIRNIRYTDTKGNILIFLTGEDEIISTIKEVKKEIPDLYCLPLYGNMTSEEQMRVFKPTERQLAIFSTDIAETSVTIDGIVYVVDSGYVKQTDFDNSTGIGSLKVVEISQASARQRAGRAGRTQPGVCYRLYSEKNLSELKEFTSPEIKRSNLSRVILQMKIMGIDNVGDFSFIDPPSKESIHAALESLILLGALNRNNGVTPIGKKMAKMPVEPRYSRMVIAAEEKYGCVDQVLTIVSYFSVRGSVFRRPRDDAEGMRRADAAHATFRDSSSDFLTIINVFEKFLTSSKRSTFCQRYYLNSNVLWDMIKAKRQLIGLLKGVEITSSTDIEKIAKAIGTGLVENICQKAGYRYQYIKGKKIIFIHPSSSLFSNTSLSWIIAGEIRETKKNFALDCCGIKKEWIEEIATCKYDIKYISLNKEEGTVEAIEKVSYNDWEITRREKIFDLETAKVLQEKRIAQAEKDGWLKLSFIRKDIFWECKDGQMYSPSYFSNIEEEKVYYCSINTDDILYEIFKKKTVNAEFEVFDFE
jgi:pre-mRNA-splicing factor ATP-dependent RNA helicase DHX16